jgi:hypothetical protein
MTVAISLSPIQSNVQAALRSFLIAVLPGVAGQAPAVFQGTISGTTLTVDALPGLATGGIQGSITNNSPLLGAAPGTMILSQLSGLTGGVGTYLVSISQTVATATTMATGVAIVAGQPNRVSAPNDPWYVVFTPMFSKRLGTNQDNSADVKFTGSIAANVLTVTAVQAGALSPGATVFGPGVATSTVIIQQLSGSPGSTGTYSVSPSQTVSGETMSAGAKQMFMSEEWTVQVDFFSPDYLSGDFARTVSIALRDEFGTSFFSALAPPLNNVSPLYADDPRQSPFIDAENQFETRWILECHLQVDQTISVPALYADAITVTLEEVP